MLFGKKLTIVTKNSVYTITRKHSRMYRDGYFLSGGKVEEIFGVKSVQLNGITYEGLQKGRAVTFATSGSNGKGYHLTTTSQVVDIQENGLNANDILVLMFDKNAKPVRLSNELSFKKGFCDIDYRVCAQ